MNLNQNCYSGIAAFEIASNPVLSNKTLSRIILLQYAQDKGAMIDG